MKRILLITLSILLCLSLMACGKKTDSKTKTKNSTKASQTETLSEPEEEQVSTSNFDKELIDELISNSDYISTLRLQASTAEGVNPSFIKDYKGDLSKIDIKLPKTLSPNSEYIVFYKDDANGEVVPTEREGAFIEIQGEKDSNSIYLDKKFGVSK